MNVHISSAIQAYNRGEEQFRAGDSSRELVPFIDETLSTFADRTRFEQVAPVEVVTPSDTAADELVFGLARSLVSSYGCNFVVVDVTKAEIEGREDAKRLEDPDDAYKVAVTASQDYATRQLDSLKRADGGLNFAVVKEPPAEVEPEQHALKVHIVERLMTMAVPTLCIRAVTTAAA